MIHEFPTVFCRVRDAPVHLMGGQGTDCKFSERIAENLFSCIEELEPAIRAADRVLARANFKINKQVHHAFSVKNMAARTTHGPNIGVTEVERLHANSTSRRMQIGTRGGSPGLIK